MQDYIIPFAKKSKFYPFQHIRDKFLLESFPGTEESDIHESCTKWLEWEGITGISLRYYLLEGWIHFKVNPSWDLSKGSQLLKCQKKNLLQWWHGSWM